MRSDPGNRNCIIVQYKVFNGSQSTAALWIYKHSNQIFNAKSSAWIKLWMPSIGIDVQVVWRWRGSREKENEWKKKQQHTNSDNSMWKIIDVFRLLTAIDDLNGNLTHYFWWWFLCLLILFNIFIVISYHIAYLTKKKCAGCCWYGRFDQISFGVWCTS